MNQAPGVPSHSFIPSRGGLGPCAPCAVQDSQGYSETLSGDRNKLHVSLMEPDQQKLSRSPMGLAALPSRLCPS